MDPTTFVAGDCVFQRSGTVGPTLDNDENDREEPGCQVDVCNLIATGDEGRILPCDKLHSDDDFDPTFTLARPKMPSRDATSLGEPHTQQQTGATNE